MFACDLWMVYSEPLLDLLVAFPSSATLVNSCGIPFIGFQSASVSFVGFLQLLGIVSSSGVAPAYLLELFVLSSSCPGRRSLHSASRGDYLIRRSYMATKQNRAFSAAGPSIWTGRPFELHSPPRDISSSFYSLLKTFLFARAWAGSAYE